MPLPLLAGGRPDSRRFVAPLVLALCAALMLAAAAPASAVTRKQAAKKALAALGSKQGRDAVIVFGLPKPVRAGTLVTQTGGTKAVGRTGGERAFFFYEDSGPSQLYPHAGRVALVGAKSGKVRVSKTIRQAPLVNRKLPAFLKSTKAYNSSKYRVFYRPWADPTTPVRFSLNGNGNSPPKADAQTVTAKMNAPKNITLTASDDDADPLTFEITKPPDHGTLSGQPPNVTYTPDPNYLGADDFHFKANDGDADSNAAKVSITVRPTGAPPTVLTSAGCTAYTEQSPAVVIDGSLTLLDPDDTTLDHATVRIPVDPPPEGEDPVVTSDGDELLFTDQNGITASYEERSGTLTLTGEASIANYQAALRSVRYRNLQQGNPAPTRDVEFIVNDSGSDSAPATKQICITEGGAGDNNKPTGETSEGALLYTENDGPVPVDAGFIALDADSANLSGATIKFTESQPPEDENGNPIGDPVNNFAPDEDELAFTDDEENGISGSYNDETGVLTLSGTASVQAYQAAIRSVTYENSSEDPSDAPRTLRFQLTDSSGANSVPSNRGVLVTPVNDAPVVTTSEGSASATGDEAAAVVDPGITAGDVDDDDLESARVRISSGAEAGDELALDEDSLSGGIAVDYDVESGVLTLTGTASVADYQAALRLVEYRHPSGNAAGTKTVEFIVNDGDLDSEPATRTVETNDKPVLDTTDGALAYTEGDGAVAVDSGITASDADSAELSGATVQLTSNFSSAEDSLALEDQPTITDSYDSETGTLTLSGTASAADYQTALAAVTYQNSSDDPSSATRTVSFQADDGASSNSLSDVATRDIEVTPVNDAPVVTTSDGSTSYTAGDTAGVAVDADVSVADVDDDNLESATVRIASGFEAGDNLVFVDQNGIAGVYNTGDGTLTLTGSATLADYQTALASIKFSTTAESPGPSRTVEFLVNDGDADSDVASKSIEISSPPNPNAPVVTTSAGTTLYNLGDSEGATVDPGLTVTDADDTDLESALVTISGFEAGDDLVYVDQLGIAGVYNTGTGVLTLTGTASVADYQTALQSIKYRYTGEDPPSLSRTIQFRVNDGDSDSNTAGRSITLVPLE
jgi:hypothetical protein